MIKTEYRKIADLRELERNPRTISKKQFETLKKSLTDNGFIGRDYSTRSKIPELALKDFFGQAIRYIKETK